MIPKETRELFSVPKRHPLAFAVALAPVLVSIAVSTALYRFTFAYAVPLIWCFLVSLYLIEGIQKGRLSDNHGTAIRSETPARFWAKIAIWSLGYLFAASWCIGFALQEQARLNQSAKPVPAIKSQVDASGHGRGVGDQGH